VDTTVTIGPNQTRRDAWLEATSSPTCASCHVPLDAVGFGFEHYDGVGRYRTIDNGHPIDASGELLALEGDEAEGAFSGAVELASKLLDTRAVGRCVAQHWMTYLHQRAAEERDACAISEAAMALEASAGDIGQMLAAITASPTFAQRQITFALSGTEPPPPSGPASTPLERRRLLLDVARSEVHYLREAVPPEDRLELEAHLEALRDLERRLAELPPG
jgi:hypothetical protein